MDAIVDTDLLPRFERALDRGELEIAYQPTVALKDGKARRVEALMRWEDPELGNVPPSRFVPLAEENGLIGRLTDWGLETVFAAWRDWLDRSLIDSVAFNISAYSLEALDFPDATFDAA